MAKLQRLQWIPMMVKAYQEARERTGLSPVVASPVEPEKTVSEPRKTATRPRRSAKSSPIRVSRLNGKAVNSRRVKAPSPDLKRVMHELRDTKRRLRQLETIQQELAQMRTSFDARLGQLIASQKPADTDSSFTQTVSEQSGKPVKHIDEF